MKRTLLALMLLIGSLFTSIAAEATSICQTRACGRIVCAVGCQQQEVNGRCVVNRCIGGVAQDQQVMTEQTPGADLDLAADFSSAQSNARCVSCAGGCCGYGNSFLQAERSCKNRCGAFGCFTRCN